MQFRSNLDLNYNQLQNAALHPTGSAPASPVEGQIYFNNTVANKKLYYYDGTAWIGLTADNYIDSLTFASGTGDLTIGRSGLLSDLTVNLDGRYLQAHPAVSAAASVNNSGRTYIQDITLDAFGHITGIVSATETVTDTHWASKNIIGATTGATANAISTNGNTWLNHIENGAIVSTHRISGTGATTVVSDASGYITIHSLNNTYLGGTGITLNGSTFDHTNSITAGSFSEGGITRTLAYGGTFNIPTVNYDAQGHITSKSNIVLTLPAAPAAYTSSGGITLTGQNFAHTSTIVAGNTGDAGVTRTLASGGTFVVPYVTYDAYGHIATATNKTLTLPASAAPYTASGGITLTGQNFAHTTTIAASSFGDAGATRTLAFGGTFTIPYVTYDAYGHIATKSNLVLTMPADSNVNTYHTAFAWTGGTTAGPTGSLTGTAPTVSYAAIPSASGTASGVVTTGAQTFGGTKTFANDIIVTGNLTVNGTVTTVNTETINLADNIITLNSNYTGGTPTESGGIEIERGTLPNASLIWNETTDTWQVSADSITYSDIATAANNSYSAYVGDGVLTNVPITHNLGTKDVIVQLYDMTTFDTIFADVARTTSNSINLYFSVAPATDSIRVLITKVGSTII